jgi:alpha-glucosidase
LQSHSLTRPPLLPQTLCRFTARPDYTLPSNGDPNYFDFGYNNITFPPPQGPLIAHYRSAYNVRFGGIRKPRLGNSDALVMAQSKGWLMGQGGDPTGRPNGSRNTNYSLPEFFAFYSSANNQYLEDGVEFFWNDEGEDDYFTFQDWSASQVAGLQAFDPTRRYFSINRAFSPGAASLGAIAWTGDIHDSWEDLANQPGYFLNWGIAGQPWVTCDTGGFSGSESSLLLARWYGVAATMPVMRVHSTNSDVPHFPFPELWGQEASDAMRAHLVLRYALLPFTYSLAHVAHLTGVPMARPLVLAFPSDPSVADMTSEWLLGEGLLVAPVMSSDNTTSPYLPAGTWYAFGTTTATSGPTTLSLTAVPLGTVPMYALAGTIIPMASPVEYSDALPAGPLLLSVYAGANGAFTLYEDVRKGAGHHSNPTTPALPQNLTLFPITHSPPHTHKSIGWGDEGIR